ncbi:gastrin/cholecystokinin type B receptor-like [Ylistrum balloti]|uniref:gastrin/cholecystokinin type B receptor-like n=1 Tax=Ylistrum balloti TaxID=509963 RepID=UPI002905C69F|nr:gastrin/cholecystokinin type B receptor-like [Ylistrum balloti]
MGDRLEDWNDELSRHLIPDSVILMIYLVVGILGNSLVIYIHTVKLRTKWEDRFFIPVLAIVDLISCVVSSSFSFSINMLPVKYSNNSACKIMFFLNMTCTLISALMLAVIALNRYRKICKPFEKQMNMFWKKIAIACVVGIALVISWPCFLFYGSKEVFEGQIQGYRCTSVRGPWSTIQPLVFKAAVMLLTFTILVSLVVFYSLIGKVVFCHMLRCKKKSSNFGPTEDDFETPNPISGDSSDITDVPDTNTASVNDNKIPLDPDVLSPIDNNTKSPPTMIIDSEQKSSNIGASNERSILPEKDLKMPSREAGLTKIRGIRLALIFMLITVVFIVCYVPKVGMMIYESQHENFWIELSPSELSGFRFIYTAFIINNIVNPIIYGFLDRQFRKEVISLCRCVKK